jgi:hypothetical protein
MYLYQRPDKSVYEYRLANGSIKGDNRHAPTRRKVLFKTPIVINAQPDQYGRIIYASGVNKIPSVSRSSDSY